MDSIKKVCILQNGLSRGGTDTFVINLAKYLDKSKFEVTVVNCGNSEIGRVREHEVLEAGAKLVRTGPFVSIKSRLKHFCDLYKILKNGKYDIFQTNIDLFNGPQLLVAWLAGVKVRACHSHNGQKQAAIVQGETLPIKLYKGFMRWMCWTFSNRRCGCSELANEFLYKGHDWKKASYPTIIPNGINIELYRQDIDIEAKKRELGITRPLNLITVGRLIPQKNPIFLAKVFSALAKKRDDVSLVWMGEGYMLDEIKETLRKEGTEDRVLLVGSRPDVNEVMKCCDAFFFPSVFEGLPIVLVEAQASGLPCVISDTISPMTNCGACVSESLDTPIEQWAQLLSDVLDKKIQPKTDEKLMRNYSAEHMAEVMEQVFLAKDI